MGIGLQPTFEKEGDEEEDDDWEEEDWKEEEKSIYRVQGTDRVAR